MLLADSFGAAYASQNVKFSMKLARILSFGVMLEPRYIFRAGPLDQ